MEISCAAGSLLMFGCPFRCKDFSTARATDRGAHMFQTSYCGRDMPRAGMVIRGLDSKSVERARSSLRSTGLPNPDLFDHLPMRFMSSSHRRLSELRSLR